MAVDSKYLQFPLCGLSLGKTPTERLSTLACYSITRAGRAAWDNMEEHVQRGRADTFDYGDNNPQDFKSQEHDYPILVGAEIVGISVGSIGRAIQLHDKVQQHRKDFERNYGPDTEVRIRQNIFWDALRGEIKYRHFAVLVAVYSALGNKKALCITRSKIRRRAMGYKSEAAYNELLHRRDDGEEPLTEKQIVLALDDLEKRGFFVRVNPTRRTAYFSNRLTREELGQEVKRIFLERALVFAAEKRKINDELKEAVKRAKRGGK